MERACTRRRVAGGERRCHTVGRDEGSDGNLLHTGVLLRQVNESGGNSNQFFMFGKGATNMERQKPE